MAIKTTGDENCLLKSPCSTRAYHRVKHNNTISLDGSSYHYNCGAGNTPANPILRISPKAVCVWESLGARAFHHRVCVRKRVRLLLGKCKNAVLARTNTLCVIFGPFPFARWAHVTGTASTEKKGPSVPASFVMGVWALLKLLAFHLSHSFYLSAKAFSTLFTRW